MATVANNDMPIFFDYTYTESFDFKKSFSKLNMFDDIYLRYIQFRTLHRRFFTNNILFKMRIKDSPLCTFCNESDDSNEHMLIECGKVKTLWTELDCRSRSC